jgi:pimeloyl-ACP methyl ester carboxylesterase
MALGVLMLTGCSSLANRLILYPSNDPLPATGEVLTIECDEVPGGTVQAFYLETGASSSVDVYVVAFSGNAARAEWTPAYVSELLEPWRSERNLRIGILAVQYPGFGHGMRSGDASLAGCAAAGRAAYGWLRERAAGRPVWVLGTSIGATVALHLAAETDVAAPEGLLIEKPPSLRTIILGRNGWWNLWLIAGPVWWGVPASADADRSARAARSVPALFVVATEDRTIRPSDQRRIAERYAGPKRVVAAACDHNDPVTARCAPELIAGLEWLLRCSDTSHVDELDARGVTDFDTGVAWRGGGRAGFSPLSEARVASPSGTAR